jgi:uncharacterized integral membrane protein
MSHGVCMDPHHESEETGTSTLRKIKIVLASILTLLLVIIVIQNSGAIMLRVLFWDVRVHLVLLIPLVFLVGLVVGYVVNRRRSKV